MPDHLVLSIGLGLAVSVLFSETMGFAAGGMIVPGYLALHLNTPLSVVLTLLAALATLAVVRGISYFVIVYGRRRTVLMILTGYLAGGLMSWFVPNSLGDGQAAHVIGYIIPGLIAIWLDRQGIVETLAAGTVAACLVRLLLVLVAGGEMLS